MILTRNEFEKILADRTALADEAVREYLPDDNSTPGRLAEAMNYSVTAGGKRIRPLLLAETYRLFGGTEKVCRPFAAAVEMVHTSSLVHDDLPAIDNDGYRRGRKTAHAFYGEALGVLSGDALLNYAYETAIKGFDLTEYPERAAKALEILAAKSGIYGMLGGQGMDVENEKSHVTGIGKDMLDYIYIHKTGALLEAPLMIGAVLAGAGDGMVGKMEEAGEKAGLAFQIWDDVLDVTADSAELGKPGGSDEKNGKTTYVTLFGVEKAGMMAKNLAAEAAGIFSGVPGDTAFIKDFMQRLADRRK